MLTESCNKVANNFGCCYCDYNTMRKSSFEKHISTHKHIVNTVNTKVAKKLQKIWQCVFCNKEYKSRVGLWKHYKVCDHPHPYDNIDSETNQNLSLDKNVSITPELVIQLIEQNKELQQALIEQNKTIMDLAQKSGTINCNNNNNKTFNLQVFLNETCKDAINLSDFINQIQVSINDLEETGKLGYAEGISQLFINNLNGIDYTKRPIHCSDFKREILYIKDENKWMKDDEQNSNLTKAIKFVANKNIKQISEWQKLYPDYSDPDSKQNDKYMKIVFNSMSGSTKEEANKNYEKIIKNIAKETTIDKIK
jgi:hypothetical protein